MVTPRSTGSYGQDFRANYDEYLDLFSTTVTRTRTTEVTDSMNRVTSTSTDTITLKADIQWITKKDLRQENFGHAAIGDGQLFVEHDADVQIHDSITYNGKQWRVTQEIEGEQVAGELVYRGFIIKKNAQT